jgi:pSer/pThr/pTyr-binding forkhead associated (FHA) protein
MPGQPPAMPPQNLPQAGPVLLILSGPRAGERLPLRNGFMIGKAPTCDLVIDDGYTSTHHAQLALDHTGTYHLYDMGSTNGTFVNGVRQAQAAMAHGVALRIGSVEIRFLTQ